MNTKEEIANFKPIKEFFIGIDSDGTAFDSMNIKHLDSFIPAAREVWNFGDGWATFKEGWTHLNLYSESRGINRFAGLLCALKGMQDNGFFDAELSPLLNFVEKSTALSNSGLSAWMKSHPSPLLDDVMRWSLKSDVLFEKHTEGLLPFKGVAETLVDMAKKADIMVVSSASGAGLDKDWSFSGLTDYTALIAGQEVGSKETQLRMGAAGKYPSMKMLMVGDAPGDLEAARSVDALFFPIVPGREEESWLRLKNEGLVRFFSRTWDDEYGNNLLGEFMDLLSSDKSA